MVSRPRQSAVRNRPGQLVRRRIRESTIIQKTLHHQVALIVEIAQALVYALRNGNKILFFGNGGSAADAQHLAAELAGKFRLKRPGLPALALTTNSSTLTALGNDFSFADIFALQVAALGRAGDVAFGISTSGKSANVLKALRTARRQKLVTIGFSGAAPTPMTRYCDYCLSIAARDTARVQEAHILAGHILCEIVEAALFS